MDPLEGGASLWPRNSQEGYGLSGERWPPASVYHVPCVWVGASLQTTAWLDLVSLPFSKQTNTDSIACRVGLGVPGQAGGLCPPMDAALSQPWAGLGAPGCAHRVPQLSSGTGCSLHPAGGRSQSIAPHCRRSQGSCATRTMMPSFVWYRQDRSPCHAGFRYQGCQEIHGQDTASAGCLRDGQRGSELSCKANGRGPRRGPGWRIA